MRKDENYYKYLIEFQKHKFCQKKKYSQFYLLKQYIIFTYIEFQNNIIILKIKDFIFQKLKLFYEVLKYFQSLFN